MARFSMWVGVLGFAAGCATRPVHDGPLPVRNQHPAQLTVLHLDPARAGVLAPGAVQVRENLAYTSLWLRGSAPGRTYEMDGETLRAATNLQVGLGSGWQAGIELPVAHTSGGFLDGFVIGYHEVFGFPDQARDVAERNRFAIAARENGRDVWSVERSDLELLDVPLMLTWQVLERTGTQPGLALRGGVELPTGDAGRGYGNGGLDVSLGVLLEQHTGPIAWYGHAQHTLAATPNQTQRAGRSFADVTSLGLAAELPLSDVLQALVQVEWETSTLRELAFPAVARDQLLLWVGGRWWPSDDWAVEVGLGEDLQGLVSPDFTAWLGVVWMPGRAMPPQLPR